MTAESEEKLKNALALGVEADKFLSTPIFGHAVEEIRADLFKRFRKTEFKDREERDEIWRQMNSLDDILSKLERVVRDGQLAQKTLLSRIKDKIAA